MMRGRRVLLTGATGFIGSHLLHRLIREGAQVVAVCRGGPVEPSEAVHWCRADLGDLHATRTMLEAVRPNVVFHLAGKVTGDRDIAMVAPTLHTNLVHTVNLLTAATEFGASRVVLAGSMEEIGVLEGGSAASSPYAAAKSASTVYARMFRDLYDLQVTTLRIAMVYGPAQRDRTKLVPYVIESLLDGAVPSLTSGTRVVDWVYVADVVDAFIAAATAPSSGMTLGIGSGAIASVREVVTKISRIVGAGVEAGFSDLPDRRLDRDLTIDVSLARKAIGWTPRTNLDDGLAATVEWHRSSRAGSTGMPPG